MDYVDWLRQHCPKKIMDAQNAVSNIKRGSRVFIGTGCGEPQHLIRAMVREPKCQDIMIYQMLSYTLAQFVDDPSFLRRFSIFDINLFTFTVLSLVISPSLNSLTKFSRFFLDSDKNPFKEL